MQIIGMFKITKIFAVFLQLNKNRTVKEKIVSYHIVCLFMAFKIAYLIAI